MNKHKEHKHLVETFETAQKFRQRLSERIKAGIKRKKERERYENKSRN